MPFSDTDQEHGEGEHPRDGKHVSRLACEQHRRLKDLLVYTLHCEELELAKEKMENKKLCLAQLQAYQGNQGGQQRQQRGRGRGKGCGGRRQGPGQGQEQRPQSTQDFDVCNNCGLKGHLPGTEKPDSEWKLGQRPFRRCDPPIPWGPTGIPGGMKVFGGKGEA